MKLFVVLVVTLLAQAPVMHDLPVASRTPGAINPAITQENIHQTICHRGWSTKSIRPPEDYTESLKQQQLLAWGYEDRNPSHYEEDHLISLEIGGASRDPRNLWPEPYAGTWGARTKDKLEDRLHKLVCAGKLTLTQAQTAIRTNWIAAYRKFMSRGVRASE